VKRVLQALDEWTITVCIAALLIALTVRMIMVVFSW
jgi:hypothetical protein